MIKYTAFNDNGRITSFGVCNEVDFLAQGTNVITGHPPNGKYYVENGELKEVPELPFHEFDFESKSLVANEYQIKDFRNNLLADSDWTQLPDVPEATRTKWQAYRQALRDITLQDGFPQNIIWPEMPE